MKKISLSALVLMAMFAVSCKQSSTEETLAGKNEVRSATAAVSAQLSNHKFIRTADVKFKVKNVAKSTHAIENAVAAAAGFVIHTNLQSEITDKRRSKVSQDSIVETSRLAVYNDMTIRVPNTRLDEVLTSISKEVGQLDHRVIKAEDVDLKILSNDMAQHRLAQYQGRVENAVDAKGKKLEQIGRTENELLKKKEDSDTAKLQNMALEDAVRFSTVTLNIYQNELIRHEVLANPDNMAFRTGFGTKIRDSLATGWYILESIISFLLQFWTLYIVGFGSYFLYKRYAKRPLRSTP